MGRAKQGNKIKLTALVPEELYAEFLLLHPEMQDHRGQTKYGSVSTFVIQAVREAVEKRRADIVRGAAEPLVEGTANGAPNAVHS